MTTTTNLTGCTCGNIGCVTRLARGLVAFCQMPRTLAAIDSAIGQRFARDGQTYEVVAVNRGFDSPRYELRNLATGAICRETLTAASLKRAA
jgi:hypothetical protein